MRGFYRKPQRLGNCEFFADWIVDANGVERAD
jgi:hypothetical protein